MITIGVDAHKRMHVALAVEATGRELGAWEGTNSARGWIELEEWAEQFGACRQWGIEGAWSNGRGLAQYLAEGGAAVYEINARWTAQGRRRAHQPGKTDRLDARAVALFVRQEAPRLPQVFVEDETAVLDLLTTQREAAVAEGTRLRNQIHALLLQTDPEYRQNLPPLTSAAGLRSLLTYSAPRSSDLQEQRAAAVRRLAQRLKLALEQAEELAGQIGSIAKARFSPLMRLCGVNVLTAGTLAGILGPGPRFKTDAQLAAYAGAAPLEASSAGRVRHRLNRGGNRRLNAILYRIVLTQSPPGCPLVPGAPSLGRQNEKGSSSLSQTLRRQGDLAPLARVC